MEFLFLSWQKFQTVCFFTAKKIMAKRLVFDRLVAISRGGLVVSRLFSDYLDLPISPFTIVSYTGFGKHKKPKVVEGLKADIKGEKILLVDEVADTGETFLTGIDYLGQFKPAKIMTAAPFIKERTKYKPDFWQLKTKKWIVFPYDIKETVRELLADLGKGKLIEKGLAKEQVNYFSKERVKNGKKS